MPARLCGPNHLFILREPDFPCLADEIAEPRPDMNIKVAAFTLSEKSINTKNAKLGISDHSFCNGWNRRSSAGNDLFGRSVPTGELDRKYS